MQLPELQAEDQAARKIRKKELKEGWAEVEEVLHFQNLPYLPEIISTEIMGRHHNDPLEGNLGIEKSRELFAREYYWPILQADINAYVKGCDVCLASKAIKHKVYGDLQSLLLPTHCWKDLSIDFVTGLPVSTKWKGKTYDSILVIISRLIKMVYYEPVKVTIVAPGLAGVAIEVVVRHYGLPDSIVSD